MTVTVPLRVVGGAFAWFLIIGVPVALLGQLVIEWRFTLFLAGLFAFAAALAYSLSKAFDLRYQRTPGTVQHRLHKVRKAAYEREFAVQVEMGSEPSACLLAARQVADAAVEAEKQAIRDEQENARAEYQAEKQATRELARAAAEERVNRRF